MAPQLQECDLVTTAVQGQFCCLLWSTVHTYAAAWLRNALCAAQHRLQMQPQVGISTSFEPISVSADAIHRHPADLQKEISCLLYLGAWHAPNDTSLVRRHVLPYVPQAR